MEFSSTTFIIQIVNFLVLAWVLKRFLFTPLKKVIEHRRDEIQKTLESAGKTRTEALALSAQYENRLKEWEKEKAVKLVDLKKELDLEKERRLKEMREELSKDRQRFNAQDDKSREEFVRRLQDEAVSQSLSFLAKLLAHFSSKEIESRIIQVFLEQLLRDKETKNYLMQESDKKVSFPIAVRSAFPISEAEREQLLRDFCKVFDKDTPVNFAVDPSLVAGVEVTVGSAVLGANLRDELKFFSAVSFNEV